MGDLQENPELQMTLKVEQDLLLYSCHKIEVFRRWVGWRNLTLTEQVPILKTLSTRCLSLPSIRLTPWWNSGTWVALLPQDLAPFFHSCHLQATVGVTSSLVLHKHPRSLCLAWRKFVEGNASDAHEQGIQMGEAPGRETQPPGQSPCSFLHHLSATELQGSCSQAARHMQNV